MGLGSTAKKLQRLSDLAEDLIGRLNDLKDRVTRMEETVDGAESRLQDIDKELTEQRAIIEAVAEAQDIDPESVVNNIEHERTAPDPVETPDDAETTTTSDDAA